VKTIGDAFLVEFANALDAVRCAYDTRRAVREFNSSLSEDRRVHLRIGVHLGDVVESAGDIPGDGAIQRVVVHVCKLKMEFTQLLRYLAITQNDLAREPVAELAEAEDVARDGRDADLPALPGIYNHQVASNRSAKSADI
jgi:nitroreductase